MGCGCKCKAAVKGWAMGRCVRAGKDMCQLGMGEGNFWVAHVSSHGWWLAWVHTVTDMWERESAVSPCSFNMLALA